jgi:DNA-binding NtrC family response regulator
MTSDPARARALLVTPRPGQRLRKLSEFLGQEGIELVQVASAEEAAAVFLTSDGAVPQFALLDGDLRPDGDGSGLERALHELAGLHQHLPVLPCVLVATNPPTAAVISAMRTGAHDIIDLATERAGGVRELIKRATHEYRIRRSRRQHIGELREVMEEFLRVLVRTERRSIDLEQLLATGEDETEPAANPDLDPSRRPAVVIVDDDDGITESLAELLEKADMSAHCFASGEAAVAGVKRLGERGEPVDLALVDSRLPGIDGIETIRQLRAIRPELPAMVMTGYGDSDGAVKAADLGVIGYVLKPFDNVGGFVERIRENAEHAMIMSRERHYLLEIKRRHEHVLARYRRLVNTLAAAGEES